MGEACAALAAGEALPESIARFGLDEAMLSPARLRSAVANVFRLTAVPPKATRCASFAAFATPASPRAAR